VSPDRPKPVERSLQRQSEHPGGSDDWRSQSEGLNSAHLRLPCPMILTLILLAAIGVILLAERSAEHLPFAIATLFLSAAAISFIVGDFDRAILLAGVLAAAITAASTIKHDYSALKLTSPTCR
jgi:hypothetical protein